MAAATSEGDIWASRSVVDTARRQRMIQAWTSAKDTALDEQQDSDNEDDFKITRETGGVGAVNDDEDSALDGILKRKRTDQDKLLEQMIGKKAAEARRKSQKAEAGKSMSISKHAAPKALTSSKPKPASRVEESDDDEDVGRAAALSSRKKMRDTKLPAYATVGGTADAQVDPDAEPPDPREELATQTELVVQEMEKKQAEDTRPKKRKVGSYLDEVLGQKGKKKSKKKKAKGGE